jgi:hypothetical protein
MANDQLEVTCALPREPVEPEAGRTYKGWALWAHGNWGGTLLIEAEFEGLVHSETLHQDLVRLADEHYGWVGIYRWTGSYRHYHTGKARFWGTAWRVETTNAR